jgi:hypothetical protein
MAMVYACGPWFEVKVVKKIEDGWSHQPHKPPHVFLIDHIDQISHSILSVSCLHEPYAAHSPVILKMLKWHRLCRVISCPIADVKFDQHQMYIETPLCAITLTVHRNMPEKQQPRLNHVLISEQELMRAVRVKSVNFVVRASTPGLDLYLKRVVAIVSAHTRDVRCAQVAFQRQIVMSAMSPCLERQWHIERRALRCPNQGLDHEIAPPRS